MIARTWGMFTHLIGILYLLHSFAFSHYRSITDCFNNGAADEFEGPGTVRNPHISSATLLS